MRGLRYLMGAAAASAMLASTPAAAQYGYQPYDPYYERRDDGLDIGRGIQVVGAIANILNAFRGGQYGNGYARPYGYAQPYGQSYGYAQPYGYNYDSAYSLNAAVNSCGAQAQRYSGGGRVVIRDVDRVSRGRLRVRGVFDDLRNSRYGRRLDRDSFSCLVYGNGMIQDFNVN